MNSTPPPWLRNWLERHQHPVSRGLHYVGIPLTVLAPASALAAILSGRPLLWVAAGALVFVGYALQWVGHVLEGNELGEVVLVKKLLGRPYVAISPRYAPRSES